MPAETRGQREGAAWLRTVGLVAKRPRWSVSLYLDAAGPASNLYDSDTDTVFRLEISADEWGFIASRPGKTSHIRIVEEPFANGHDQLKLAGKPIPALVELGPYLHHLERLLGATFSPGGIYARANIAAAKPVATEWLAGLLRG